MLSPAVPELIETNIHECLEARTDSLPNLRELGPPDLVELIKQAPGKTQKQTGFYHHVTGVDASSSASLAAYINTLTYTAFDKTTTKIVAGTYCCYNAFSRVDMRIDVTIPGGVECYCIDERGIKREADDDLWLETYLCSVLRAYSYADDGSGETIRKIMGVRRFNPITNTETEHRFLQAAELLFFRGWQLGSNSMVQVPNNVSNHLTTGLLAYFHATGRFSSGINLFEKLRQKNTEVSSLLAKVLLMGNEEVGAVRVLHAAIKESPMDYVMLDTQAEFLKSKALKATDPAVREERLKMALGCADKATVAAPSEFGTWARLADVFVAMEDWESALVTLNSCPMFTYQDKDAPHMPEPRDVHLPVMPETKWDEIDSETEAKYNEPVHPSLLSLRGSQYKGTFKKAYSILTEMTKKIGWDQLLRIRSQVFVMEEEYRTERQPSEKRNASIDVIRGTPEPTTNGSSSTNGDSEAAEKKDGSEASASVNGDADADADASSIVENDTTTPASAADAVAQPSNTVAKVEAKAGDDTKSAPSSAPSQLRFNNKRLCERWLDSLFMVLYEDLRIYTIWRTEAAQYRQGGLVYKKGAEEWEILGSLAARLHHDAEALEAWRSCLGIRFSPKAAKGVLELSRKGGQASVRDTVGGVIRLVAWQYRWFSAWSPQLVEVVRGLVEEEGALKVRTLVQASGCPAGAAELSHGVVAFLGGLRSSGSEG